MATYANTTICSETDVTTRYGRSLDQMLPDNDTARRSVSINEILDTAKNVKIKDMLLLELPKRYPTTAKDLTTRFLGARDRRYQQENYEKHVNGTESLVYSKGVWINTSTLSNYIAEDPAWFFYSGVPDSSTYANSANNGAWLINTAAHAAATRLYINRGTLATPSWVAWSNDALLDLMLYGTTALKEAALQWFAFLCYESLANGVNDADERKLEWYADQRDEYEKKAYRQTIASIPNLGIDKSNDGILSDDELESTQGEAGYFA